MALIKRPSTQSDKPFLLRGMLYGDSAGGEGKTTSLGSFLKNKDLKVVWIAADATTMRSLNFVDDIWGVKLTKGQLIIAEIPKVAINSLDGGKDSETYLAVHKPLLGAYPAYDAFDGLPTETKKLTEYGEDTLVVIDGLTSFNSPILFKGEQEYALRMVGKKPTQYDGVYNDQKKLLYKFLSLIQSASCHIFITAHNVSANSADAVLTPYGLKSNFPNLVVKSMVAEFTKDFNWVLFLRKTVSILGKPDRFVVGFDKDWFTKTSFNELEFEKQLEELNKGKSAIECISLSRLPCDFTHPIYNMFPKGETN